jgi:hypothetical protein
VLLFVAAAVLGILAAERGSRRLVLAAALVLGAALVVGPAVVASSRAAGSFVFVRSYGAINLWMGNDPAGGGVQNARPNAAWDRLVGEPYRNGAAPGEEERYFTKDARRGGGSAFFMRLTRRPKAQGQPYSRFSAGRR